MLELPLEDGLAGVAYRPGVSGGSTLSVIKMPHNIDRVRVSPLEVNADTLGTCLPYLLYVRRLTLGTIAVLKLATRFVYILCSTCFSGISNEGLVCLGARCLFAVHLQHTQAPRLHGQHSS